MLARLRNTRLYRRLSDLIIRLLIKEHGTYAQRFPNDVDKLAACLRPGDVILVEGSQRISQIIKYLTQSSWSHAALYVGDTVVKRGGPHAEVFRAAYGNESNSLLVEASVETGVTAVPLTKYKHHNIRICRPINLRPADLTTVLDTVVSQIGTPYNVRHIVDLLRYFLPVSLIGFGRGPAKLLEEGSELTGNRSEDMICSSQIAMAFQKVRYPIQPTYTVEMGIQEPVVRRVVRRFVATRRYSASVFETGIFTPCDPRLVTPRDFDLSPYFEVVKLPSHDRRDFDYKKLRWSPASTPARSTVADEAAPQTIGVPETEPAIP